MSEKIKRINRELKFKGKILDFYQDTIEVDGDHTVVWDFIGHKGAAAVVPVTADGKILMVRQYRNALDRYTLEIPAGALDEERIEVYVAHDLIPSKQHLDEDEFIELGAYTIEELKEKIFSGEIEDAKTVSSLMAYAVKYGK